MASNNRALTRTIRDRAKRTGESYTRARNAVLLIQEIADDEDITLAEAEAILDDPRNQIFCKVCGWTNGMVCPECPGCGCYNSQCSGWRHDEYAGDDDDPDPDDRGCPECGAGSNDYDPNPGCPACNGE
jgi:hypothetical protein